jgi:hypothetical protein
MSVELQQQIDELKQRVRGLEQRGAGPRGVPGDISVAVSQAVGAARDAAREEIKTQADRFKGATGEVGPAPSNELLDTLIVQVLHDYGILEDGQLGQLLREAISNAAKK